MPIERLETDDPDVWVEFNSEPRVEAYCVYRTGGFRNPVVPNDGMTGAVTIRSLEVIIKHMKQRESVNG